MELLTGVLSWWKCHWPDLKSASLLLPYLSSSLASSLGISSSTPLKPQHNKPNPNSNPLTNQLWCIKPELGVIPSGQENLSRAEHLNFPGRELNVINLQSNISLKKKPKTGYFRTINLFPSCFSFLLWKKYNRTFRFYCEEKYNRTSSDLMDK